MHRVEVCVYECDYSILIIKYSQFFYFLDGLVTGTIWRLGGGVDGFLHFLHRIFVVFPATRSHRIRSR